MRSLTPTALSILARSGSKEGIITKCAVDPETNDVYATVERMEDGVEVGLVKYEITPEGVQTEVSFHIRINELKLINLGARCILITCDQPVSYTRTSRPSGRYPLLFRRPEFGHPAFRRGYRDCTARRARRRCRTCMFLSFMEVQEVELTGRLR
jgi:hypothetical protein